MDFNALDLKIKHVQEWLNKELASLRTGRASPLILENIKIDYYGKSTPLSHLSSIRVEDARTLVIEPWDKNLMEDIAKGISKSGLGIQPVASKDFIRIVLPPLTQERRRMLSKIVGEKLEEARISLRTTRDEYWSEIKKREREKEISQDDKFQLKEKLEEAIKKGNAELEKIAQSKKQEIES